MRSQSWQPDSLAVICSVVISLILVPLALGDTFHLKSGGVIEGELLNADERPRMSFRIRVDDASTITIDAKDVRRVIQDSPAKRAYDRMLPRMPATSEGNWRMSQWCAKNKLADLEQFHLEEVLRLDPNHQDARKRLGYTNIDGRWVKPREHQKENREEQGYRMFAGRWRVEQEIALIERRERQEREIVKWRQNIRRWRGWLKGRRADAALNEFRAINDPAAASVLADELKKESNEKVKALFVETLGRLETPASTTALVQFALEDDDANLRDQCLAELAKRNTPQLASQFTRALGSGNPQQIERAAVALADLNVKSSIPYLIDALTTKQRRKVGNPGQISPAFSRNGSGTPGFNLGVSGKPKIVERTLQHRSVLQALVALSGGANFQYDKAKWKSWYAQEQAPDIFDLRRGGV